MLTDDAVRAVLERIDPIFLKMLDGATLPMHVDKALRLLAESQHALGEIVNTPNPFKHDANNAYRLGYCDGMEKMQKIARNAVKGGK